MDRRTFLALFLTAIVIVLTPMLFRGFGGRRAVPPTQGDTVAAGPRVGATASAASAPALAPLPAPVAAPIATTAGVARVRADTVSVEYQKTRYTFTTVGADRKSTRLNSSHLGISYDV